MDNTKMNFLKTTIRITHERDNTDLIKKEIEQLANSHFEETISYVLLRNDSICKNAN